MRMPALKFLQTWRPCLRPVHAGGRGVIDAIEKQLELAPEHVAPSREALYRYGNVSSSSIWVSGVACREAGAR